MNRLRPGGAPIQVDSFTGRKKVTLTPGHSLMDWIRLGRTHGDLSGVGPVKKQVSPAELAVHNTQKDIWMAIRGKVYNITPYMDYHPGGTDELMRAAGKDGTELFDEIHNWVNVESMLEKCLVGTMVVDNDYRPHKYREDRSRSLVSISSMKPSIPQPTMDWYQSNTEIVIVIYTKWEDMQSEFVIVDNNEGELLIEVLVKEFSYFVHINPSQKLLEECNVKISEKGKVDVVLGKQDASVNWKALGKDLKHHNLYPRTKTLDCRYRAWTLTSNTAVSHDTRLLRFKAPKGCRMAIPIGYHVHVKTNISGMDIARSYTAVRPSLTAPFSDKEMQQGKALYLMIKSYPGGALSPWICGLKAGDKVQMSNLDGTFDLNRLKKTTHLVMFAAGTGFTSMIGLIAHSLFNMKSATFPVTLVFYNKTLKDILWRDQLDELAKSYPRFKVTHVLSQETDSSWKGLRGRVTIEHVKKFVPTPKDTPNPLFCICGQWAYNDAVESLAKLHGLADEHLHLFSQNT